MRRSCRRVRKCISWPHGKPGHAGSPARSRGGADGGPFGGTPGQAIPGGFGAHAYDQGRVFTVGGDGTVTAYDAASGAVAWTASMRGSLTWSFGTVPTAYRGVLYTSAAGEGGTLFAFNE